MNRYFISKLSAQATDLTVYGKALSAIVLQQAGETVKAKEFVQSVMEYSVVTDKMGRYFDTPKAHYSWFGYKIPTEVAAMEGGAIRYQRRAGVEPDETLAFEREANAGLGYSCCYGECCICLTEFGNGLIGKL